MTDSRCLASNAARSRTITHLGAAALVMLASHCVALAQPAPPSATPTPHALAPSFPKPTIVDGPDGPEATYHKQPPMFPGDTVPAEPRPASLGATGGVMRDWAFEWRLRSGPGTIAMGIGVAGGATDYYDNQLDRPYPPPLPFGFYASMPIVDPSTPFIHNLVNDIRGPKDTVRTWRVVVVRTVGKTAIRFDRAKVPANGRLIWNGFLDPASDADTCFRYAQNDAAKLAPETLAITWVPKEFEKAWAASRISHAIAGKDGSTSRVEVSVPPSRAASSTLRFTLTDLDGRVVHADTVTSATGTYSAKWDGHLHASKDLASHGPYRFEVVVESGAEVTREFGRWVQ